MKKINVIILIMLLLISCSKNNNEILYLYTPVDTNCNKEINITFFDRIFYMITGSNNDEYGNYKDNLEYEECIKNKKIKNEYEKILNNKNYEIKYYEKEKLEKIDNISVDKKIKFKELEELKRKNNFIYKNE